MYRNLSYLLIINFVNYCAIIKPAFRLLKAGFFKVVRRFYTVRAKDVISDMIPIIISAGMAM